MAAYTRKDKLTIVLVIVSVIGCGFSDGEVQQNYAVDSENDFDVMVEVDNNSTQESRAETPSDSEGNMTESQTRSVETSEVYYDTENATDTTVNQLMETTTAGEEVPEAQGLKNFANDYEDVHNQEKVDALEAGTDVTEAASPTTIDNNVYKTHDIAEDVYSSRSGRDQATETPTAQTTRNEEVLETLASSAEEDQLGNTGQRIPKTDGSDSKQPIDKRNNDARPRSNPIPSKSSTLRSWLEDSWLRPPAGILVPLRPNALKRALDVWKDLTAAEALKMTDIVIVGFDSNGINWRSRHNLQASGSGGDRTVTEALSKLILKYQGVRTDASRDGTMKALASAAKLVPYDSALFLITDKEAGDPQKLPLALRALIEKRLKVYTIWTDPSHPSEESELALQELRNVSSHTEGDVLPYSLQNPELDNSLPSEAELQQWEPLAEPLLGPRRARLRQIEADSFDTLLVWRGGGEAISLGIPVEAGVTALRVLIEGAVDHAALFPPNEAPQVDLYNRTSVQQFSSASKTLSLSPRDVYLGFPGAPELDMLSVVPVTPMITDVSSGLAGVWHLSVRCDSCDYRLTVFARSQVHFQAEANDDTLSLRVLGAVTSIRESSLVDEYGTELSKLPFSYAPMTSDSPSDHPNPMTEIEEEVPLPKYKGSRVYAKILGRNVQGDPFVRFAGPIDQELEIRNGRSAIVFPDSAYDLERLEEENTRIHLNRLRYNDSDPQYSRSVSQVVNQQGVILTSVLIGLSSRLYGSPGDSLQLHFEVSNHREQAVRFQFGAQGELRFLRSIEPSAQTIPSGQTVNVIVNLIITSSAQPGTRDLITFTAYGLDQVSTSAYVYVLNPGETQADTWAPQVRHTFQGHCIGRTGNDCGDYVWSATIFARDNVGGLLRITSSPSGLTAAQDSRFISGTREETVTMYRATCCNPRVLINAVDIYGNTNSYAVDISGYITDAGIAAIVLGVLLVIALIALIIFLITWCVRKRRSSRELPSYATSSRNIS
ncbi:uncharacterized protein [Battus philenor]|uniref:uncharacterized protein n=1 Tax=Battus philenor TaxID=42288 RepID=UPI0035D0190C